MTFGVVAARVIAGVLLGAGTLVLSSSAARSLSVFSAVVWSLAVPVSGVVAFLGKLIEGKHFQRWRSAYPTSAASRYLAVNSLTGAPLIALAAYPGMFLAIALLMAP